MKVKLIKVNTYSEHISFNYGDDYTDIVRHIVNEESEWEDVSELELYDLEEFVRSCNSDKTLEGYYILITEPQPTSVKLAINVMKEKARIAAIKREQEMEKRKEIEKQRREQQAAKQKERLIKKLEKLQAQIKDSQ